MCIVSIKLHKMLQIKSNGEIQPTDCGTQIYTCLHGKKSKVGKTILQERFRHPNHVQMLI
jgi:hypothetical protein